MTVSVRPWAEISADLRRWNMVLTREAADAGDALAAENADRLTELDAEIAQWMTCVRERDVHIWKLDARLAAVHAALDQYDDGLDTTRPFIAVLDEFVSAVAKAVRP